MLQLADILEALTGIRPEGATTVITEGVIDSRLAIPGALFVALPGERTDGHQYVAQAFQNGASLALVQQEMPEGIPVLDLRGVTMTHVELANRLAELEGAVLPAGG